MTPRPIFSTREVENLSDETEELCSSSFFPDLCDNDRVDIKNAKNGAKTRILGLKQGSGAYL